MPRYYTDLGIGDRLIHDEEGDIAKNLTQAKEFAVQTLAEVSRGYFLQTEHMSVQLRDSKGQYVWSMTLSAERF